jgi:mannose-6-phosphate isomerase
MWYIVQADKNADLSIGFKKTIDRDSFIEHAITNRLPELINTSKAQAGEAYFIPAGLVHGGGKGLLIAEIQQTSDITYRIYDWDRKDSKGHSRELHIDMALDALDYTAKDNYKSIFDKKINELTQIVRCDYFTVNRLQFDKRFEKDYSLLDSFVIYMCIEGSFTIEYDGKSLEIPKGQTVLIPAKLEKLTLLPQPKAEILEIYVS